MALFSKGLIPASFRGVPFAVLADDIGGGRRIALHQYPGRDTPWAEDMGREARRWHFRGFIVTGDVVFAGGPVQLQRATLIAALEKAGPGTLTHPTLGILNVSVQRFTVGAELGAGRMSNVDIEFVESGKRNFASLLSTASGLFSAANLARLALVLDGVRVLALLVRSGTARGQAATTTTLWGARITALAGDATALHRLTAQLPGSYGRFTSGGNAGLQGTRASTYAATATTADLVRVASSARALVVTTRAALDASIVSVALADATDVADAIVALVDALAAACADPADAIRVLLALIATPTILPDALSPAGSAIGGMVRRAAAVALTRAVGEYQPTSADDAVARILAIGTALDTLATDAADKGDDASYKALRGARAAIVADLRARGSNLASVKTFTAPQPSPSLALAQRLYRDPARTDQLVTQVRPRHPLFMPTRFEALAA